VLSRKVLFIDYQKCTGCRACEALCSLHHYGEVNPARAHIRVMKSFEGVVDLPLTCQQCEDAPCEKACLVGAISRNRDTGAMLIDQSRCIGCRICIYTCPFGAIHIDPVTCETSKCDLCNGDPQCITFCVTGALRYERMDRVDISRKIDVLQMICSIDKGHLGKPGGGR
jgi:carbon-monoxide dehydrogenase iron sulfur subunit